MHHRPRSVARAVLILAVALAVLLPATPAAAHDPIFLTTDQTTPDTGPYLPDGAISWALYGTFPEADQTRGFEFDLRAGDDLYISLLIPNLEPELSLPDAELPYVELTLPDGEVRVLEAEIREIFDEQFSQTSYVTLVEQKEPAIAGRHSVVVYSRAPARFTVAVGEREEFFTPADRTVDRPESFLEIADPLNAWYQTPPGEAAAIEGSEAAEVDVQAIEDELERMAEAEAQEGEPAVTTTAEAVETAAPPPATDEPETDDVGADDADDEAAPVPSGDTDDDPSLGWVLPVAILAVLAAGGGWMFMRRNAST
ncbi:MAG: hypothetical protein HKN26_03915 [Acidimicrobiales bacterium]|nr:hypothetical protein [Acidimicrobiales bacterium]